MRTVAATAVSLSLIACVGDAPLQQDASVADVGTSDSGAADAGDGASGPTFCTGHANAAYCEDFDRSATPPWSLSVLDQSLGAFVANESAFTSPPRSLQFNLTPATGTFQGTFLGKVVQTSTAKGARLSLSVRFDKLDPTPGQMDFFILRTDGVGGVTLHRTTTANTDVWAFGPSFQPITKPPLNKWLPIVIDVTFDAANGDAGGGNATLTLDGMSYQPIPSNLKPPASTVGVLLGGQSTQTTTPSVHYSIDDVVLELK